MSMDLGSISTAEGPSPGAEPVSAPAPLPTLDMASAESPSDARLPDGCLPRDAVVRPPWAQVMSDEQLETLRRQISVYATICQQLVEMHKATMAQQNAISGLRFGQSSSCDSGLHSLGQKFTSRQRWTPSQTQLQILEKLFQQGNGTPTKQRIKEISTELSQYGQISETNVYNWFQNRRARTKRKQQSGASNNTDSEFDTDIDSQEERRTRADKDLPINIGHYEMNLQRWEHVEHQQLNAAQNGVQSTQRQPTLENYAASYSQGDVYKAFGS